jgi:hypothetical protein
MKRFPVKQAEVESLKRTLKEMIDSHKGADDSELKIKIAILKDIHFRLVSESGFDARIYDFFELVLERPEEFNILERRVAAIWPVFKASKVLKGEKIHTFENFSEIWRYWCENSFTEGSISIKQQEIVLREKQKRAEAYREHVRQQQEERAKIAAAEREKLTVAYKESVGKRQEKKTQISDVKHEKEQEALEGLPEKTSVIVREWLGSHGWHKQVLFELLGVLKQSRFSPEVKGKLVEQSLQGYSLDAPLKLMKELVQVLPRQEQESAMSQQLNRKLSTASFDELMPMISNWLRLNKISSIRVEEREKIFFKYDFKQAGLEVIIGSLESLHQLKILQQFDCKKILDIIFEEPRDAVGMSEMLTRILRYFNEQGLLTEELIAISHHVKMPSYMLSDFHSRLQKFLVAMDTQDLAKKDQQLLVQVFAKYFKHSKGDELRDDLLTAVVPLIREGLLEKIPNLLALIFEKTPAEPLLPRGDEPLFSQLSKRIVSLAPLMHSSDVIKSFIVRVLKEAPEALLKIEDWVYPEIEKFSETTRHDILSMLKSYCEFVASSKIISADPRPFVELKGDFFFKTLNQLPDEWKANELVWKALCYKTMCMPRVRGGRKTNLFYHYEEELFSPDLLVKVDIRAWDPRTAFLAGRLTALFRGRYKEDPRFSFITETHYEQMYQSSAKICALAKFFCSFVLRVEYMQAKDSQQQEAESAFAWLAKEENFEKILKLDPVVCHYLTEAIDRHPLLLFNPENLTSLFALSESDFALVVTAIALREKINQTQLTDLIASPKKAITDESFNSASEAPTKKEFSQLAYASRVLFLCTHKERALPDRLSESSQLQDLPDEILQHIASLVSDTRVLPDVVRQHIIAEHFAPVPKPS